jgi:hypothetical protein
VLARLDEIDPEIVLIEAPADAQECLAVLPSRELVPPVALFVFETENVAQGMALPFAEFSPEWQAMRWASDHGRAIRFIDLPWGLRSDATASSSSQGFDLPAALAAADGHDDPDAWWDERFELTRSSPDVLEALGEAVRAVRPLAKPPNPLERIREAFFREQIRRAVSENAGPIAVVCGAWHVPALETWSASPDSDVAVLHNHSVRPTQAAWIPWSHERMVTESGYGAGIASPGWWHHLWSFPDQAVVRWIVRAARLLRDEDLDASSACVIEAVRLAEALAALRGRVAPGYRELQESLQSVLCHGQSAPLALIRGKLDIGESLGHVPSDAPPTPLWRDVVREQAAVRLPRDPHPKVKRLDLRKPLARRQSRLIHRLRLLDIAWGQLVSEPTRGTFKEVWRLAWRVEFAARLIEANVWGSTLAAACAARLDHQARQANRLGELARLIEAAQLADLPEVLPTLLARIADQAADPADGAEWIETLGPLVRLDRYGQARANSTPQLRTLIEGIADRVLIGLSAGLSSLKSRPIESWKPLLASLDESLRIYASSRLWQRWGELISELAETASTPPRIAGWCTQQLVAQGMWSESELADQSIRWLSPPVTSADALAWLEGLLDGAELILIHQQAIVRAMDRWLTSLTPPSFLERLPMLRKLFARLSPDQRRDLARQLTRSAASDPPGGDRLGTAVPGNPQRAAQALLGLEQLLVGKPQAESP